MFWSFERSKCFKGTPIHKGCLVKQLACRKVALLYMVHTQKRGSVVSSLHYNSIYRWHEPNEFAIQRLNEPLFQGCDGIILRFQSKGFRLDHHVEAFAEVCGVRGGKGTSPRAESRISAHVRGSQREKEAQKLTKISRKSRQTKELLLPGVIQL